MTDFLKKNIINYFGIVSAALSFAAYAASSIDGIQIYQKDIHQSAEHKQKLAEDIQRYQHADNMWDLIRSEFSLPHYEENEQVQAQMRWFLNNRDYLQRTAERAAPYLYFIMQQASKRHLPAEIVLLPMIESAFNPFNYSSAGAAGIWQLMPGTASGFGVKQNWWYDGRRDVIASTKAALDYLVYLGNFFDGNWLLAIAAYDTGEGNVLSAIRKNTRLGISTDFWSLPLAQETRVYVPRLLALASIVAHLDDYNIQLPAVSNAPYLAQVDIGGQIDLQHAATLAGLTLKELKKLNPGYSREATDPNGPFKIILPIENVSEFTENLMESPLYEKVQWVHYTVKSGETLTTIAKKFNTSLDSLRKMNSLSSNNLKIGTRLVVPQSVPAISKTILENEPQYAKNNSDLQIETALKKIQGKYTLQPGDTLYMVRKGDTLEKISNHFHISIPLLLSSNKLKKNTTLTYGQQIIIPTHLKAPSKQKYQLEDGDTIYMVRSGDTLDKIASKFHTSAPAIRIANLMASNHIVEGDQLIIPNSV